MDIKRFAVENARAEFAPKNEKMDRFNSWFSKDGHWLYQTRAEAFRIWATNGLEGFPSAPPLREVHMSLSQSGARGLFDKSGAMVIPLSNSDDPARVARDCGWSLV